MVVLPAKAKGLGVSADLYEAVGAPGFSKDIVVSDEECLARLSSSVNSVQAKAAGNGVTLYENGRTDQAAIEKICR